jgi:ABC-type transport system substrate-binding protein
VGKGNLARFRNAEFDALFNRLSVLPDGPEREALFERATKYLVAYAPYRVHVHRILTDLAYPQLVGWRRPEFWREWWHCVDIEPSTA